MNGNGNSITNGMVSTGMILESPKPILKTIEKKSIRVLRPMEYKAIWNASKKFQNQIVLDTLLLTAGRITELKEMQINRQWFDFTNNSIHVKEHKIKRMERGVLDRYIHLSIKGSVVVQTFLHNGFKIPSYPTIQENLRRWATASGISTESLSAKTFRKTYESWLVFSFPEKSLSILQSTGHTQSVALSHYLNMPFTEKDKLEMSEYVTGWL
jgi:integrase